MYYCEHVLQETLIENYQMKPQQKFAFFEKMAPKSHPIFITFSDTY